jgi:hypothetical protein
MVGFVTLGMCLGGEHDHTMDRDSVCGGRPGTRALGGSGALMSDVGAALLIFVMLAIALTAVKRRRSSSE